MDAECYGLLVHIAKGSYTLSENECQNGFRWLDRNLLCTIKGCKEMVAFLFALTQCKWILNVRLHKPSTSPFL